MPYINIPIADFILSFLFLFFFAIRTRKEEKKKNGEKKELTPVGHATSISRRIQKCYNNLGQEYHTLINSETRKYNLRV